VKTLSLRDLSRATLARQMLLAREKTTVPKALARLLAIQAQWPKPPFVAFWSRLVDFDRADLVKLARKNAVVRGSFFRGTIFLLAPEDWGQFRGTIGPSLERAVGSVTKGLSAGDRTKLEAFGRKFFGKKPATFDDLRTAIIDSGHPEATHRQAAYWIRMRVPLLQVATDVPWGWHQSCDFALSDIEIAKTDQQAALVLRYLAALGPASVADAQNFTGISKLKETFEGLRERLVTFEDDNGKELFDLPKAPRPDADTPAPVRFLPDFDNTILSHADRRRFVDDAHKPLIYGANLTALRTFMVDGRVAGLWRIDTTKSAKPKATLQIQPFGKLTKAAKGELEEEGMRLLAFSEPEAAAHHLVFVQQ
jgi:hypothetical protein